MKATEARVEDFLSTTRTRFVIPVYQRNYDWTHNQCRQLFSDILKAGQSKEAPAHFIGSIVYVHDGVHTTADIKEFIIIDGQQRLTTLTLILLAIYKLSKKLNNLFCSDEILNTYLTNQYVRDENERLKLKLTSNNASAFQFILKSNDREEYTGSFSRIINNFDFFKQHINEDNYEDILRGIRSLIFVEIALDRINDNPQRIFESLNSTGLELSQADLIRNYILMGLDSSTQTRIYHQYWSEIESYAKNETTNESKVSDFIRNYLTIKNKKIPTQKDVYIEFKDITYQVSLERMEAILNELKTLSIHYNKLLNPNKEKTLR